MPTLVIVGAQWGDEAKGKLVDVLGGKADLVVRCNGGNNAGHTVITGGKEFKFHLIPAGILHPQVTAIVGGGMVVCPKSLLEELDRTRAMQPNLGDLGISPSAHVVFPYHRMLDRLEEEARGERKIGTTLRGIGPAYQDKVARIGIRMSEFVRPTVFESRLCDVLAYKNRLLNLFGEPPIAFDALYAEYSAYADRIRPFVADTDRIIQDAVAQGKRVLFEGSHGAFLDLDTVSYPFVTSSHTTAGAACFGTGIGPRDIDGVLGVAKAYTTRVGSGPFPTELNDEVGDTIRTRGKEFGTTTGRGRRCGWLDLVLLRQSCRMNSLSGLVVTRLDILSGFEKIQVAKSYMLRGERIDHLPSDSFDFAEVEPSYTEFEGWTEDLRSARNLTDLPKAARIYLDAIEEFTQTPITAVSVGPDREETIFTRPELAWG